MASKGVVLALPLVLVISCALPSDPLDPIALRRTPNGDVELMWGICDSDVVTRIAVETVTRQDGEVIGREMLWGLTFEPGENFDRIVLGDPPRSADVNYEWDGFDTSQGGRFTFNIDVDRMQPDGGVRDYGVGFGYSSDIVADFFDGHLNDVGIVDDVDEFDSDC